MSDDLNPTYDLQRAIEKLEKFADQNEAESVPLVVSLDQSKNNSLDRTIGLAKNFISTQFSGKTREEQEKRRELAQREMLQAIAVVKSNYLLIQKLNRGTAEQQKLAESAMQAVERYNAILNKTRQRPPTWSSRISQYVYEKCALAPDENFNIQPIHLPFPASVQKNYSSKKISKKFASTQTEKVTSFMEDTIIPEPILRNEEEAFRVKAISLLRNYGIRFTSTSEEFSSIRLAPMQATKQDQRRVLIRQILKPFPGEVIEFKGEFERDENTQQKSVPIPSSFEISTKSNQTGFPHPSQHNGWALSDLLIPGCPYHFELLPHFRKLYTQKQTVAKELLPEGKFILHARELLKIKKDIFAKNSKILLKKQSELNSVILSSKLERSLLQDEKNIIDHYFQCIENTKQPYEVHCELQELILSHFIVQPYEKIQDDWVHNKKIANLDIKQRSQIISSCFSQEFYQSLENLSIQLKNTTFEPALDYIALMGPIFGSAASAIILQHLSETLRFPPPMLSDFDLKMQTSLYQQLLDFHTELNQKNISLQSILGQLDAEIALFETESFDDLDLEATVVVKELEVYYNSSFYNQ